MWIPGIVVVGPKMTGCRVESIEASIVGPDPHHPLRAHPKALNQIAAQALRISRVVPVREEPSRNTVEPIQSSPVRTNPQPAGTIFSDGGDLVIGEAVGVFGIVLVEDHLSGFSIQPVKAPLGPDPKKSARIRMHGQNRIVAQAVWIPRFVLVIHKRQGNRLKPAHPNVAAYPQISFGILE